MINPHDTFTWDKTNIEENYPGVTAPLTYSFIREAYQNVYQRFLSFVGVRNSVIKENTHIFQNMLGYINAQVYYNISYWYEFLKLLPGYTYNKEFFETMLNPVQKNNERKVKTPFNFIQFVTRIPLFFNLFSRVIFIGKYHKKFDNLYAQLIKEVYSHNVEDLKPSEIIALYDQTSRNFFDIWVYTILNDFRTMIFFGVYTKLLLSHKTSTDTSHLSLTISKKPSSFFLYDDLKNLSTVINSHDEYKSLFAKDAEVILSTLKNDNTYQEIYDIFSLYLQEYGERSVNELKLEYPSFQDEPQHLIQLIKLYLTNPSINHRVQTLDKPDFTTMSVIQRIIFMYVYNQTVSSIYKREEYRLKRSKVFSIARKLFLTLGARLAEDGLIKTKEDVFYVYKDELFNAFLYHSIQENFIDLVAERKQKMIEYKNSPLPRFIQTQGLESEIRIPSEKARFSKELKGIITSLGTLTSGEVVVMSELDLTQNLNGKVLVTQTTDPGWTIVFPLLKGIITEKGGVLSHASIVAREFGIPCMVQVENATQVLKTGDRITFNTMEQTISILS